MKKFLVLTSITGGKDELEDPSVVFENCDYIAYVDKIYDNIKVWEQREVLKFSTIDKVTDRRNAKPYKIISTIMFPNYEYIIWQDGNHKLKENPETIVEKYGKENDILLFKHPDRNCVYQEMSAVVQWQLDYKDLIEYQFKFYKSVGMPDNYGLFEMSTFIVKNTPQVKELQLMWFEQINKFSSRDQISFPYCLWKMGTKIKKRRLVGFANLHTMQGNRGGNNYFEDKGRHLK